MPFSDLHANTEVQSTAYMSSYFILIQPLITIITIIIIIIIIIIITTMQQTWTLKTENTKMMRMDTEWIRFPNHNW